MSLNRHERSATRDELRANLALSGVSQSDIATDLGLSLERVCAALDVDGAPPVDVWLVRDYLDRAIRDGGLSPRAYSSLTEDMRAAAQAWFPLADVEDVMNRGSR